MHQRCRVSPGVVSKVTDTVMGRVTEWQSRKRKPLFPVVCLYHIVVKIRENQQVIKKSRYLASGVELESQKDLFGSRVSENEGVKFWLSVLTELRGRGVDDILIACVDGLKGFPEAVDSECPKFGCNLHSTLQHALRALERLQASHGRFEAYLSSKDRGSISATGGF